MSPASNTWRIEAAQKRAGPYDKIVGQLPEMRADTGALVKEPVSRRIRAYVLVNNRTEGNAPLTVQALVDLLNQPAPCQSSADTSPSMSSGSDFYSAIDL